MSIDEIMRRVQREPIAAVCFALSLYYAWGYGFSATLNGIILASCFRALFGPLDFSL